MSHHTDPFATSVQTAHTWLATIANRLGTEDRMEAYKAMRAWLHTVRDRLGVSAAAHLSAQLPEMLRGIFYEGWIPAHVPVPHDAASFVSQFAREAGVAPDGVLRLAGGVTDALAELFSPGQLDHVLAQIPVKLRMVLLGTDFSEVLAGAGVFTPPGTAPDLEQRVQALADAVTVLTRGLESMPGGPYDTGTQVIAAARAHRILQAEGLTGPAA